MITLGHRPSQVTDESHNLDAAGTTLILAGVADSDFDDLRGDGDLVHGCFPGLPFSRMLSQAMAPPKLQFSQPHVNAQITRAYNDT